MRAGFSTAPAAIILGVYAFHDHRNMIFVDGENFTIRGQEFAKRQKLKLVEGKYWEEDVLLWLPYSVGDVPEFATFGVGMANPVARSERAYYYTAVQSGDDRRLKRVLLAIRALDFEPRVFKKAKGETSKGVDVSLTTALVSHAYRDDFDVAYLLSGDGDYVPVVEEVKNAGKRVVVAFFGPKHGLSPDLQIAADRFVNIEAYFTQNWAMHIEREEKRAASASK